ncbi:putative tripeptidyl-peptidase II [Helianthus debilis subsp. tardiflorus]
MALLLCSLIFILTAGETTSTDPTVKTYIFRVNSESKPSIFPTHYHWYTSEFTQSNTILHVYDTVFNGFSASMTPSQASSLQKHPDVLAVIPDRRRELHTTRSPQFVGLRNQRGLWSESDYGSDVIIGVFDTGIWPERRSFSDLNLGPIPKRWRGVCQIGVRFSSRNCNRKIIGARFFSKGHEAAGGVGFGSAINETVEFRSPRDADGHGTHTASTAAGSVSNGEGLVGDAHLIPACSVGSDEGDKIKAYAATGRATATINFQGTVLGIKPAPVVASFSGRGPNGMNPEILKPDLIAPGVNILAAWTDAVGPTGLDSDTRKTEFNILSGTSMSCPHVSGAAALLKSAHPDWSPAAIKSAIMTTASTVNKQLQPMTDESTGNATTPYDFGAGHLNLDLAMDPGLVYDLTNQDYVSFLCSIGYGAKTIQVITRSPAACPMRRKPAPENLNYPSIAAMFSTVRKGVLRKTLVRRVRNVGDVNSVYTVKVEAPKGVGVTVKPGRLVFSDKVRELSYYVTVKIDGSNAVMGDSGAVFGSLSWVDGKHVVRSPIVVTQLDPL